MLTSNLLVVYFILKYIFWQQLVKNCFSIKTRLTGATASELCSKNSEAAKQVGRFDLVSGYSIRSRAILTIHRGIAL